MPDKCKKITIIHNRELSDHGLVLGDFNIRKQKPVKRFVESRSLTGINFDSFQNDLKFIPWDDIMQFQDVQSKLEIFNETIIMLFDKHAPLKRRRVQDSPKPWITCNIRLMMTLRDEALLKALTKKTDSAKSYYKNLRNFVTASVEREKSAFITHYINNNLKQPKKMWNYLKKLKTLNNSSMTSIPDHLMDSNSINNHFLNVPGDGVVDNKLIAFFQCNKRSQNVFSLSTVSEETVGKILLNIKTKASGCDGINSEMIQLTLPESLPLITNIINSSILSGVFLSAWKRSVVKPIPKCNSVEELKDLRPISILPVISKVLEKVVYMQMEKFINQENILPKHQSGFRKSHGTETALLKVTDDLLSASDSGMASVLVLLDFSRAFECLNPYLLVAKLSYYGFSSETCEWFKSYLIGREQYVELENGKGSKIVSSVENVLRGTPQGSILSPILFSLFTADLSEHIKACNYHLYADDTQIYHSFEPEHTRDAIQRINEDLNEIYEWAQRNSLVLNALKSKFMILGTKTQISNVLRNDPRLAINFTQIPLETEVRNLGMIMDSALRYEKHVNDKIKNAFYKLKVLYPIRKYISEEVRGLLCDHLVLSPFNYCSAVYGPRIWIKTENAIQRVQNACARFCFNIPRRDHVTPYLVKKNILNMKSRRELHLACVTQKVLYNKKPEYLFEKFSWSKDIHQAYTRSKHSNTLAIPLFKKPGFKGCFKLRAAKIWNDLPPPLRTIRCSVIFKTRVKLNLLVRQRHNFEATFRIHSSHHRLV